MHRLKIAFGSLLLLALLGYGAGRGITAWRARCPGAGRKTTPHEFVALGRAALELANREKREATSAAACFIEACRGDDPEGCVALGQVAILPSVNMKLVGRKLDDVLKTSCSRQELSSCVAAKTIYDRKILPPPDSTVLSRINDNVCALRMNVARASDSTSPLNGTRPQVDMETVVDSCVRSLTDADAQKSVPTRVGEWARSCQAIGSGCLQLSLAFLKGIGVPRDYVRAYRVMKYGCEKFPDQPCDLDRIVRGAPDNHELRIQCDGGYLYGCSNYCYRFPGGENPDDVLIGYDMGGRSMGSCFERACDSVKYPGACLGLGESRREEANFKAAVGSFSTACEGGNGFACSWLAYMATYGEGMPVDTALALKMRAKACDSGDPSACGGSAPPLAALK